MMFSKETKFQDSPMGIIPKDWEVVKMDNVAYVKGRIGWRGLKASEYTTEGPYLIANKHLVNNKVIWDKCDHLSEFRYEESSEIQLQTNDIIISKDGTIGQPAFIEFLPDRATINSTMMLLRITNSILEPKFLFYFLQGLHFRRFLKQKISGTSIPHLFQRDMKVLRVLLPSVREQRAVVGVLGVVDSAILKVDEVIWKTERLKKGLMQQLLTRGIGHKEYKDTPIGKIPQEWKIVELREVAESIKRGPFGGSVKKEIFVSKGFKVYEQKNVIMNDFSLGTYYIDKNKFDEMKSFAIKQGDILLTGAGTIGKIATVPKDFAPGIINQALIRITLDRSKILIPYFTYLLNHETYTRKVLGSSHGATMKNISSIKNLSSLKIPLPSITEQQRIIEILSVVDKKLEMERNGKAKLERIKRGLMDLLLTGRVRVKVD